MKILCEIDSFTPPPPPNMSDLGPRDNGWPIHQSEALTVLYLYFRLLVTVGLKLYRL